MLRTCQKISREAISLNSSKSERIAMLEQPAIELMLLAIELEPVNAVTGFIERLKENDVRQMSHFRKFLP